MNNIINYSIIIIITLVSFILIINISKIENKIKLKGSKIVLFFIILMSYMTLVSFPVKNILNKQILEIKLPKGKKGTRGDRGATGSKPICDTCGDDLCLKKILFNITNTYNYWRQLNGLKPYPDTYVIKNEYLKDKILKHCNSKEYQKIIKKYGSNRKKCPNGLKDYNCGVYDYLFKVWSIWTLIILKYRNGSFFLESDSLTETDFDGLIEEEDSFLHNDLVIFNGEKFKIDSSSENLRIYPMFHIINITNNKRKIVHVKQLKLSTENYKDSSLALSRREIQKGFNKNRLWSHMFTEKNSEDGGLKIKRIKKVHKDNKIEFSSLGISDDFFKNKGIPERGKLSPFDEIKKYDAWYWGRDENLKPEIIIEKPITNEFKKTCPCGSVKFKKTNNFYEIFSSKYKKYNKTINPITIDEILGNFRINDENDDIVFLRASKFIDTNEHGYFKEYKPIGDIVILDSERASGSEQIENCKPNFLDDKNGFTNVIGKQIAKNIDTYLVSGDTKSPVDFELVWTYKKTEGINRGYVGLNIWKPIPPTGYIALGLVVDERYFDETAAIALSKSRNGEDTKTNIPKPPFDSIACVPISLTTRTDNGDTIVYNNNAHFKIIQSSFFLNHGIAHNNDLTSSITIKRNTNTNTFISNKQEEDLKFIRFINENSNLKCGLACGNKLTPICDGNDENSCKDKKDCTWDDKKQLCKIKVKMPNTVRSGIKDKKYSILKLYE